jgi:hypothetical protein
VIDVIAGVELAPLVGHNSPVNTLRFTSDGKSLISLEQEGLKMTWNVARIGAQAPGKLPRLTDEQLEEVWNDLAESDVFRSYRASRYLAADPERTLPFLEKRVKPIPPGETEKIKGLIQELQNQNGGARRRAMTELRKHGEAALGALNQSAEEQRHNQAVQVMIVKLEKQVASPDRQRALKAVRALENMNTDGATALLNKLSHGAPGARLTTEAKAALERIAKK